MIPIAISDGHVRFSGGDNINGDQASCTIHLSQTGRGAMGRSMCSFQPSGQYHSPPGGSRQCLASVVVESLSVQTKISLGKIIV